MAENLRRINPDLELELHFGHVTTENAFLWFGTCEVVVEAFDQSEAKMMLMSALLNRGPAIVGASGIAGWGCSNEMKVCSIGENLYLVGDQTRGVSENLAPYSPRVGIAAAMQANTVISLILGETI